MVGACVGESLGPETPQRIWFGDVVLGGRVWLSMLSSNERTSQAVAPQEHALATRPCVRSRRIRLCRSCGCQGGTGSALETTGNAQPGSIRPMPGAVEFDRISATSIGINSEI